VAFAIETLTVADEPAAWARAGFTVDDDGTCRVGSVRVELDPEAGPGGIVSWTIAGVDDAGVIDGLPTVDGTRGPVEPASHPNGTTQIDHVVVATPDLDRTVGALRMFGFVPRRTREAGRNRQTFFRLGEVILEVVGPSGRDAERATAPATFWGLAFTVEDLTATAAALARHLGPVKDAVQPGRRIATLRHEPLGISVPVAFMSADTADRGTP
jgi:hypothetical protein